MTRDLKPGHNAITTIKKKNPLISDLQEMPSLSKCLCTQVFYVNRLRPGGSSTIKTGLLLG